MNTEITTERVFTRPIKTAVLGFLGFMAVVAAIAIVKSAGMIDAAVAKRATGLVIGLLIVITGNFVPKMRPLSAPGRDPSRVNASERFAGWTLVFAGIAYIALFAFAPLDRARMLSSTIGIAAMVLIAANWAWLARAVFFPTQPVTPLSPHAAEKRRLLIVLLFAFFWILATACAKFLFNDQRWVNELGSWMTVAFCFLYAALLLVLDRIRPAKSPQPHTEQ
jgi:hypothetical protein